MNILYLILTTFFLMISAIAIYLIIGEICVYLRRKISSLSINYIDNWYGQKLFILFSTKDEKECLVEGLKHIELRRKLLNIQN